MVEDVCGLPDVKIAIRRRGPELVPKGRGGLSSGLLDRRVEHDGLRMSNAASLLTFHTGKEMGREKDDMHTRS